MMIEQPSLNPQISYINKAVLPYSRWVFRMKSMYVDFFIVFIRKNYDKFTILITYFTYFIIITRFEIYLFGCSANFRIICEINWNVIVPRIKSRKHKILTICCRSTHLIINLMKNPLNIEESHIYYDMIYYLLLKMNYIMIHRITFQFKQIYCIYIQ